MDLLQFVRIIHIISSGILFGSGIGIAFFMFRSWHTDDLHEKYFAARNTVLADILFTLPSVIIQPLSGLALIYLAGYDWGEPWLLWAYGLYILAGMCWVPVVSIQIRLRDMVAHCLQKGIDLPDDYHRLFRIWFVLGWPAFIALIIIFYLMVVKPG